MMLNRPTSLAFSGADIEFDFVLMTAAEVMKHFGGSVA